MNIQELRNKCNNVFAKAIDAIENHESVRDVRNGLLDTAQLLVDIGKQDISLKSKCDAKARALLNIAKSIHTETDYDNAYMLLLGKPIPAKAEPHFDMVEKPSTTDKEDFVNVEQNQPIESPKDTRKDFSNSNVIDNHNRNTGNRNNYNNFVIDSKRYTFNWDERPTVSFDDVAGLDEVKETVQTKVLLPLKNPELFEGYTKKSGGGILLYGPPGTGKTMIAAAIAHEINAKFCSIGPSDLLTTGVGNSEKLIATLFKEARSFPCSVIFFDEFESLCPVTTHAQHARQIRSELLKQMQGLDSYGGSQKSILLLIGATNKPWDIDPAFVRPGRLGTRVYVDLPDADARRYIVTRALEKIKRGNSVLVDADIDIDKIVESTDCFNGADMTSLIDKVQEMSIMRAQKSGEKRICNDDFEVALKKITSSVQKVDIQRLDEWRKENN